MKPLKKTLRALVAAALLSAFLFLSVSASAARLPVGLNGASGKWSDFDQSVYDLVTDHDQVTAASLFSIHVYSRVIPSSPRMASSRARICAFIGPSSRWS